MVDKRPKLVIDQEAQVQIDAAREAFLRMTKRGKSQVGESAKTPGKSLAKLGVQAYQPPSCIPRGHGLEVIARSASILTFNVLELKIDLVGGHFSYLEKIEDSQLDKLAASQSATVANCLANICFEVNFQGTFHLTALEFL